MTIFLSSPFTKGSHQSSMTFLPLHYSILFRVFLSVCQCSKSFLFFFFKDILVYYTLTKTVSSIRVFLLWLSHYKSSAFLISSIIHMSSVSYLLLVLMAITKFKKKTQILVPKFGCFLKISAPVSYLSTHVRQLQSLPMFQESLLNLW